MRAGQEFVKKIGVVGGIMFTLMFILFMLTCFSPGSGDLDEYTPPHNGNYYALNLDELKDELMQNVFPAFDTDADIECAVGESVIEITVSEDDFWKVRTEILKHFDQELFEFTKK